MGNRIARILYSTALGRKLQHYQPQGHVQSKSEGGREGGGRGGGRGGLLTEEARSGL